MLPRRCAITARSTNRRGNPSILSSSPAIPHGALRGRARRYEAARQGFWAVVDGDPRLNFGRATVAQNALIRRLAEEHGLPLVDGLAAFEHASPHGIPGIDLFADGHHPNLRGYWVLASAAADTLAETLDAELSSSLPDPEAIAVRFGLGPLALARAHVRSGSWLIATAALHPWPVDRLVLAERHFRAAADGGDGLSSFLGIALSQAGRNGGFLRPQRDARPARPFPGVLRFEVGGAAERSRRNRRQTARRRRRAAVLHALQDLWS